MSSRPPYDKPSDTFVVDGEVVVIGPSSVSLSFTPEAARETGIRLTVAADKADHEDAKPSARSPKQR